MRKGGGSMLRFIPKNAQERIIPEELKNLGIPEQLLSLLLDRGIDTKEKID